MKNQRLSLEDFKVNKLDAKNEIAKLLGGEKAGCHVTVNRNPEHEWPLGQGGDNQLVLPSGTTTGVELFIQVGNTTPIDINVGK